MFTRSHFPRRSSISRNGRAIFFARRRYLIRKCFRIYPLSRIDNGRKLLACSKASSSCRHANPSFYSCCSVIALPLEARLRDRAYLHLGAFLGLRASIHEFKVSWMPGQPPARLLFPCSSHLSLSLRHDVTKWQAQSVVRQKVTRILTSLDIKCWTVS